MARKSKQHTADPSSVTRRRSGIAPWLRTGLTALLTAALLVGLFAAGPAFTPDPIGQARSSSAATVRATETGTEIGMITGRQLFSEDFDSTPDGQLPEGFTLNAALQNGGSAEVHDGKLVIDATNVELGKVLLPDALSEYGNYTVEADVAFTSTRDTSRWLSLVVRQQPADQEYYHMCVRRGTKASNGVEFAIRKNEWNVLTTAAASTELGLNNEVHIRISIVDDLVYEYVDGETVLITDALSGIRGMYTTGGVGVQANFSVITVDNITVSECSYVPDTESYADKQYISHNFLKTPVISAAGTVSVADSGATLDRLLALEQKPENLILYTDDSGSVVAPDGSERLGTLAEVTDLVFRNFIPVYYVKTDAAASALIDFLKESKLVDAMVISDRPDLVATVRSSRKRIGGVIDYTSVTREALTGDKLDELIYDTNINSARTALISEELATKANVEYMQHRLITVWVKETSAADDSVMLHNAIQSGANGIVTDTPEALIDAYSFYASDPAVLVRTPMVIGHRGLPSSAPENSIESAKAAVAAGVDCIELDVRLSSDGKVYIYHDNDLSSLTTGKGTVNSHTAAELDSINILKSGSYGTFKQYPQVKLPSLEAFFEALKDDDVMFFVEIKEDGAIASKVAELVNKYGLKNRCCMITFLNAQVTNFQQAMPGMSCGQLMGTPNGSSYEVKVNSILGTIASENATFNASGVSDTKLVRALMYRGITAWPWTYNNSTTRDAYLLGAGGITTDFCNTVSNVPTRIDIGDRYEFTLNPGKSGSDRLTFSPVVYDRLGVFATGDEYGDAALRPDPVPVVLEGAEHIKIEGNTLIALSDGTVRLMYKLETSTDPDHEPDLFNGFCLYTQVVTLTLSSDAEIDPAELPTATPAPSDRNSGQQSVVLTVIIAGAVIVALTVLLAVYGKHKDRSQKRGGQD